MEWRPQVRYETGTVQCTYLCSTQVLETTETSLADEVGGE